ncbi:hypothetical protein ADUPG1_002009 [Aduncisulcus paluster]|uniref:Uncharacterized protein n=1 Tax=Aduncisulcus paluster TaxID=2918883 RepID=A0ABQ5KHH6_9EUKA|nr:hypothetical protein ADUPG1_002009 [Aduncisulcus paluster]
MFVKTRSSAKVERWRTFLSDFTEEIPNDEHDADLMRHRTNHVKASRKPLKESDDCPLVKIKGINDKTKEPVVRLAQVEEEEKCGDHSQGHSKNRLVRSRSVY